MQADFPEGASFIAPLANIACSVPYGAGGLGRHFAEMVEASRSASILEHYWSSAPKPADQEQGIGIPVHASPSHTQLRRTPVRFDPGWMNYLSGVAFDRSAASRLPRMQLGFTGFAGQSLQSLERARSQGVSVGLIAATSHVQNVARQHRRAHEMHRLERPWLNSAQVRRTLREYQIADVIYVASEYSRLSSVDSGFPSDRIVRWRPTPATRYDGATRSLVRDGVFRIIYVGSLTVSKGIPVLLEAFARFPIREARLSLVGGWSTRGMRRHLEARVAHDPRISITPGDPLPHLVSADVLVHPSWEDGFAYSGAEALAVGVPVIVREDTGMKELVEEGVTGYVVPTGDVDAIVDRLLAVACRTGYR